MSGKKRRSPTRGCSSANYTPAPVHALSEQGPQASFPDQTGPATGGFFSAMMSEQDACAFEASESLLEQRHFDFGDSYNPNEAAWSSGNLAARIDYQDELAGTDTVKRLMIELNAAITTGETATPSAMYELATLRGQTAADADAQWGRFLGALEQQRTVVDTQLAAGGDRHEIEVPQLDRKKAMEHRGSLSQLRFGSYVGQVLGMDPVLGAMLSPTGGLVGPGNASYSAPEGSTDTFHGEAHDAFGYLGRYHGEGPGYTYADQAVPAHLVDEYSWRPYAPYSGQASGYRFFHDELTRRGQGDPNSVDFQMQRSAKRLGKLGFHEGAHPDLPMESGINLLEDLTILKEKHWEH